MGITTMPAKGNPVRTKGYITTKTDLFTILNQLGVSRRNQLSLDRASFDGRYGTRKTEIHLTVREKGDTRAPTGQRIYLAGLRTTKTDFGKNTDRAKEHNRRTDARLAKYERWMKEFFDLKAAGVVKPIAGFHTLVKK